MAVNDLSFNQAATLLNAIVGQATGRDAITTPVNTKEFVTLGQTALKTGYDTVSGAISQVLSRTIFSIRPYTRKFSGLEVSEQRWGNITRKIYPLYDEFEDDEREPLTDGSSVDMYAVHKPKVQQTNFYGFNKYQTHKTIYRDQLDVAFSGPDQFAEFISMIMQDTVNDLEQSREDLARMCIGNLLAGSVAGAGAVTPIAPDTVVHLITEYNQMTGGSATLDDCLGTEIIPFAQFVYGRIGSLMDLLEARTVLYHTNITAAATGGVGYVKRHTPKRDQKVYLSAQYMNQFFSRVASNTFNDRYLSVADYESVAYWQNPKEAATPMEQYTELNVLPSYLDTDGTIIEALAAVDVKPILGIIFDREAAGYTLVNQWSQATPFNAAGGYYNIYWHESQKYWNDFTENHIVLMLD